MPSVLVTGSSRGLGLEFVRQYAAGGWTVLATCRNPKKASALKSIADRSGGRVTLHAMDVAKFAQVDALAKSLKGTAVDVVINNAGLGDSFGGEFGDVDYDAWEKLLRVNTMAVLKVASAFLPLLERGKEKKFVTISSALGSIGDNTAGGMYAYRSSKAGANAVTRSIAMDLKDKGIIAVSLHPGWVKTDMGGADAQVERDVSIAGMRKVIAGLTPRKSGSFFSYEGKAIPW
jgi:NAD(P)-dependent dehydrogenase (short-subunit alcohol dehydrogenase family)